MENKRYLILSRWPLHILYTPMSTYNKPTVVYQLFIQCLKVLAWWNFIFFCFRNERVCNTACDIYIYALRFIHRRKKGTIMVFPFIPFSVINKEAMKTTRARRLNRFSRFDLLMPVLFRFKFFFLLLPLSKSIAKTFRSMPMQRPL